MVSGTRDKGQGTKDKSNAYEKLEKRMMHAFRSSQIFTSSSRPVIVPFDVNQKILGSYCHSFFWQQCLLCCTIQDNMCTTGFRLILRICFKKMDWQQKI